VETRVERLTDVRFWDEGWWQNARPRRLRLYRDVDFETVRWLRRLGEESGGNGCRTLEMGGGASRVLPYLAGQFGHQVVGSDFSWNGCRLLRANLELAGVEGAVVCEDLFQPALEAESFDLVYSSGLIEHFADTRSVVAQHLRLLKPGGRLFLIVPNLQGIQGRIFKRLARPLWDVHRVFGPEELVEILTGLGMERVAGGYLGSFFIHVGRDPEWSAVRAWPGWLQVAVHGSVRLANGLVSLGFRLLPWRPHSRILSPAFFASGVKHG
jgi:SAM-dependent methyltransferase